jgi:hypothetical protein
MIRFCDIVQGKPDEKWDPAPEVSPAFDPDEAV